MDSSWLILVSLVGFVMASFWAEWWDGALRKSGISRPYRVAGVLVISLVSFLIGFVGPWVLLMILHGTVADNLADPRFPLGVLMFFGPGVGLQIFWALYVALRRDEASRRDEGKEAGGEEVHARYWWITQWA